jgi:hypothetical protein
MRTLTSYLEFLGNSALAQEAVAQPRFFFQVREHTEWPANSDVQGTKGGGQTVLSFASTSDNCSESPWIPAKLAARLSGF